MDNESIIEKLLKEKKDLSDVVKKQKESIQRLYAYRRTFIKSLVNAELSVELPVKFEQKQDFEVLRIENGLFLLGVGNSGRKDADGIPESFKVLRYFKKTINNPRANENTWYTTTVLNKNGQRYFIIKDDENNSWRGYDAFHSFVNSFAFRLPFNSVDEWIGLNNPKMIHMLKKQVNHE